MNDTELALVWHIDIRLGNLGYHGLINLCQDALAKPEIPPWTMEIACLEGVDILDAGRILESHLLKEAILPDSQILRDHIRTLVLEWTDIQDQQKAIEMSEATATVISILHLIPNYAPTAVYVPIEEYPYPPSGVQSSEQLAKYIRENIDQIVPRNAT